MRLESLAKIAMADLAQLMAGIQQLRDSLSATQAEVIAQRTLSASTQAELIVQKYLLELLRSDLNSVAGQQQ